jgi:hypothetical protein
MSTGFGGVIRNLEIFMLFYGMGLVSQIRVRVDFAVENVC